MIFKKGNEKKKETLAEINELLTKSQNSCAIFSRSDSLTCGEVAQIRKNARKEKMVAKVFPNKLFNVALENNKISNETIKKKLKNNNFVIFSDDIIKIINFSTIVPKSLQKKVNFEIAIENKHMIHSEQAKILSGFSGKDQLLGSIIMLTQQNIMSIAKLAGLIAEQKS